MPRELTPRQQLFIAAYQRGIPGVQAAIEAGYSRRSAKHTAHQLLRENPLVRAELERVRQHLADKAEYNGQRCMDDLDKAIEFAIQTKQPNAYVKAIETKARLFGLLRDKVDVSVEHKIDVTSALAAAKARVQRPSSDPALAIEGEFVALPSAADVRPPD